MTSYVLAEAEAGYRVVFALVELDSGFLPSEVLVADTMDGSPLAAKLGRFRLVAPHEKRPARWVRMLKSITVVTPAHRSAGLSEIQLQRQLNHARIARRCNRAERGAAEHDIRRVQRGRVGHIENLSPEIQGIPLGDHSPFDERQIRILIARPAHRIARATS